MIKGEEKDEGEVLRLIESSGLHGILQWVAWNITMKERERELPSEEQHTMSVVLVLPPNESCQREYVTREHVLGIFVNI